MFCACRPLPFVPLQAPLRYRLLPTTQYINIEYYAERQRLGLPVDGMVGVHCGYLKEEGDKIEHLERHGFLLRGIERQARMARLVANLSVNGFVYNRSLPLRLRRKRKSSISVIVR